MVLELPSNQTSKNFCSTTSTLSAGSTGSQARLIQSSHPPESFQPMQTEDLGKQNSVNVVRTVKAEVHTKNVSPSRSPQKQEAKDIVKNGRDSSGHTPNHSRRSSPNHSRKPSPNKPKRSDSVSPRNSRRSSPKTPRRSKASSPKPAENGNGKSPKKIKSSLKQPSRSLSIEAPTCVECYLSAKSDPPG